MDEVLGDEAVLSGGIDATMQLWLIGGGLALVLFAIIAGWLFVRRRAAISASSIGALAQGGTIATDAAAAAPVGGDGGVRRFFEALSRSRAALQERFATVFSGTVDEAALESLEEGLIMADVGVATTDRLLGKLRERLRAGERDPDVLRRVLKAEMAAVLDGVSPVFEAPAAGIWVILVVGVNGSGKTTTIGKLAAKLGREGRTVLVAAGDTFRAAAAEQLTIWAERAGAQIVSHQEGADPGAVVYDALEAAKARGCDVVIIDTAGRLQTRKPLMEQLTKVRRVIQKHVPDGPHETLLVLDGTMGQNGMSQARLFHEATPLTGVVVTKLDGTAKGGMILAIADEMRLPVKFVGLGEKIDDLRAFEPLAFIDAIA